MQNLHIQSKSKSVIYNLNIIGIQISSENNSIVTMIVQKNSLNLNLELKQSKLQVQKKLQQWKQKEEEGFL